MKSALTIAGSDPTGGAGIQADLKVFRSFGLCGLSAISVLTAQNTEGVDSIYPVGPDALLGQLRCLLSDITPDAVKVGMLYRSDSIESLGDFFTVNTPKNLVIDPVTVSSSGMPLIEEGASEVLVKKIFPFAKMITPNIQEAYELTGIVIRDIQGMREAARALMDLGPEMVIITGGHFQDALINLFYDGAFQTIETEKKQGEYHGTGCAFSASLAALLALGQSGPESFRGATQFVHSAVSTAVHPGRGMRLLNI